MNDIESAAYAANLRRAEPVARAVYQVMPGGRESWWRDIGPEQYAMLNSQLDPPRTRILYTTPPASELVGALEDARRWRWLRRHMASDTAEAVIDDGFTISETQARETDAAIDAALALTNPKES